MVLKSPNLNTMSSNAQSESTTGLLPERQNSVETVVTEITEVLDKPQDSNHCNYGNSLESASTSQPMQQFVIVDPETQSNATKLPRKGFWNRNGNWMWKAGLVFLMLLVLVILLIFGMKYIRTRASDMEFKEQSQGKACCQILNTDNFKFP